MHGKPAFARMFPRSTVICRLHFSIRSEARHQQVCTAGRACVGAPPFASVATAKALQLLLLRQPDDWSAYPLQSDRIQTAELP